MEKNESYHGLKEWQCFSSKTRSVNQSFTLTKKIYTICINECGLMKVLQGRRKLCKLAPDERLLTKSLLTLNLRLALNCRNLSWVEGRWHVFVVFPQTQGWFNAAEADILRSGSHITHWLIRLLALGVTSCHHASGKWASNFPSSNNGSIPHSLKEKLL